MGLERGKGGAWGLMDVPFVLMGSGNLRLWLSPNTEILSSGLGDENCQKRGCGYKKKKRKKDPLALIQ